LEGHIKLVIFDLDGTLVHLPIKYEGLKNEISRILKVDEVNSILETISNVEGNLRREIFEVWDKFELEALQNLKENRDGMEIYNRFHGKTRCLVTLQGMSAVKKILEKTGLSFDYIVTREDSLSRSKQIKMVIEKFGANVKETLFVGDRESDRRAAEEVGCSFIFVGEESNCF